MRVGWAGLLTLLFCIRGQAMDVDVHFDAGGMNARIRVTHVPAREPLGAVKFRLKLQPGAASDALGSMDPPTGPWSQFMPQVQWKGGGVTVWAMAPNIGESRDSSSQLIADLTLSLAPGRSLAVAADLIDSVIVEEAWTPSGKKAIPAKTNLTTGLRASAPMATAPVERIHGLARTLDFTLGKAQRVRVSVSDFRGRRVAAILDRKLGPGMHEVSWDGKADGGRPLPVGSYFLRLEAGAFSYDKKLEVSK